MIPPVELVLRRALVMFEMARFVVVALPVIARLLWTRRFPVVVAPPKMVRPPICVPEPMVDEANAVRPRLNCVSVVVAFPAAWNGYADEICAGVA